MADRGPGRRPRAAAGLPLAVLGALLLGTLALRPQLLAIGPLLPRIQDDLAISHAEAGLLTTIPVLCMGLFAPVGPKLAGRLGARNAMAVCLLLLAAFGLLRAVVPGMPLVSAATIGVGIAMGVTGALPAIVVKQRAERLPGLATGAYSTGIVGGATIAAALAVPLSLALGGWRAALAALAVAGLLSLVSWWALLRPDTRPASGGGPPGLPWRVPTAWLLMVVFGLQSMLYYGVISWLPDAYVERGWSQADAGNIIAVMHIVGLAAGLAVPWLADRFGSRRSQLVSVAVVSTVGLLGVVVAPDAAILWAFVLGVGLGAVFPLVLVLPVDVADHAGDVGAAAGMMLLGGYLFSGLGPVVLGVARDLTGDFAASLWLLVGLGVLLVAFCGAFSPARLRRGVRPAAATSVSGTAS